MKTRISKLADGINTETYYYSEIDGYEIACYDTRDNTIYLNSTRMSSDRVKPITDRITKDYSKETLEIIKKHPGASLLEYCCMF